MRKKYYDDAKENAAFERGVDVVTALILKYGPAIKRECRTSGGIGVLQKS